MDVNIHSDNQLKLELKLEFGIYQNHTALSDYPQRKRRKCLMKNLARTSFGILFNLKAILGHHPARIWQPKKEGQHDKDLKTTRKSEPSNGDSF